MLALAQLYDVRSLCAYVTQGPFTKLCMIRGGLQDGMSITVCGRVLLNADRFNVNLQHGAEVVALQVNPRYQMLWVGPGYVVHNTHQNGTWGWEEHKFETPFPRGQTFSLQILITQESYKILANGKPFSEYKHRMPFLDVDRICVVGMVELSLVTFHSLAVRNKKIKKCIKNLQILSNHPRHAALPGSLVSYYKYLTVPYKSIIYEGVQPAKCIIIQGVITPQAKRVEFSLRHKTGIAFYYSLCFDEDVVVCNSYEDGTWGNEEQSGLKLFERGQPFQVTICCSPDNYKMFVNGENVCTYSHRYTKLEEIDVLEVSGDVQLSFVQP
uniref:Galectin n=1 Tax=Sinocyclocheilus rhinocerous TaxID=307959 RepID=A0A673FU70_9TELE